MTLEYINPDGMHRSPVFSQGIVIPANARIVFVGGQNGVDASGSVVGNDLGVQTGAALDNLIKVLEAAGSALDHLVRLGIYVAGDGDIGPGLSEWMKRWGDRKNPPTITVLRVAGFPNTEILIEIEATAYVP